MDTKLNNVKIEILKNFLTQSDFAAELEIHESKVSQILKGRRQLNPKEAKKWIKVLRCAPSLIEPVTKQCPKGA